MDARPLPQRFADEIAGTPYRHVRALAQGGMGEVHVVEHRILGTSGVMKVIRAQLLEQEDAMTKRLIVEARSLRGLRHPNLVEVLDFGFTSAGRAYLITELLEGRTLKAELLARGRLPLGEAIAILDQTLAGLAVVHGGGVVHRDLKPDNLFYCGQPDEPRRTIKVLDFGVAKILTEEAKLRAGPVVATQEGMSIGTPLYMSPEQALGRAADARADLYSLGAIMFHLLTGRPPFVRDSVALVMEAHVTATIAPASLAEPALPRAVDAFIGKAMEKRPEDRFQSAEEMRAALASLPTKSLLATRGTVPMSAATQPLARPSSAAEIDTLVEPSPFAEAQRARPEPARASPAPAAPQRRPSPVAQVVAHKTRKLEIPAHLHYAASGAPRPLRPSADLASRKRFWSIALWIASVLAVAVALAAVDRWLR